MQEQISEVFYYLKGAAKYRWIALIFTWIVCLSGWIAVSAIPDKYTSEAKVHVDTRTMLLPLLRGMTVQSDIRGLLRVMQLLMFTQKNLEQIIELANLKKDIHTDSDEQKLKNELKKDIKIRGGSDNIFTITYEATNPNEAKKVVQSVLTVFSEQTQKSTLAGVDVAHRFIDEQIQEYENRLKNAEKARENFKRTKLALLPGGGGGQIAQAQGITNLLDDAKLQLREAHSRRDILASQLNEVKDTNEEWGLTADANKTLTLEEARIAALNKRKTELLVRFTENHPEVQSISKVIEELESQKANLPPVTEDTSDLYLNPSVLSNPYVQSIKLALNEADAAVAAKKIRVDELQQRVDKLNKELDIRLSVETELQNLNRDYDTIKSNYDKLLQSREQATMSAKVDTQAESLKFKIADPPNVPLEPSSPKRKLLHSGVLIAGIGLGVMVAFLLYFLRPTIMSTAQLRNITQLPVIGSVSRKDTVSALLDNRKDAIKFSIAMSALLFVYFGFMLTELLQIKLFKFISLSKHFF